MRTKWYFVVSQVFLLQVKNNLHSNSIPRESCMSQFFQLSKQWIKRFKEFLCIFWKFCLKKSTRPSQLTYLIRNFISHSSFLYFSKHRLQMSWQKVENCLESMKAFGKFDFKERIVSPHDRMLFKRPINDLFNNLSSLKDLLDKTLFFIIVFMIFFNFDNSGDHVISFSNLSQGYFIRIFRVFL